MKTLFTTVLIFTTLLTQAQFVQTEPTAVDLKLDKFRRTHNVGTALIIAGITSVFIHGYMVRSGQAQTNGLAYFGYALTGSGIITNMVSYSHLSIDAQVK